MDDSVFLDVTYSYRKWPYLVFVVVFGGLNGAMLVANASRGFEPPNLASNWLGVIFGAIWCTGTSYIALWCAWRYFLRPTSHVRIDAAGITIDGRLIPWSEIESLYGFDSRGGKALVFTKRGRSFFQPIWHLPVEPLSAAEYDTLCHRLEAALGAQDPKPAIGH